MSDLQPLYIHTSPLHVDSSKLMFLYLMYIRFVVGAGKKRRGLGIALHGVLVIPIVAYTDVGDPKAMYTTLLSPCSLSLSCDTCLLCSVLVARLVVEISNTSANYTAMN